VAAGAIGVVTTRPASGGSRRPPPPRRTALDLLGRPGSPARQGAVACHACNLHSPSARVDSQTATTLCLGLHPPVRKMAWHVVSVKDQAMSLVAVEIRSLALFRHRSRASTRTRPARAGSHASMTGSKSRYLALFADPNPRKPRRRDGRATGDQAHLVGMTSGKAKAPASPPSRVGAQGSPRTRVSSPSETAVRPGTAPGRWSRGSSSTRRRGRRPAASRPSSCCWATASRRAGSRTPTGCSRRRSGGAG